MKRWMGMHALAWWASIGACGGEQPLPDDSKSSLEVPTLEVDTSWPPEGTSPARNALLIVMDTTRDDAVRAASTPHLDALAAAGARVERSWAGGTWTVPSVVSLLTGRFVRHHGWDAPAARMGTYPALPDVPRLPEVLRAAGFTTSGHYANPYLSEPLGFDRGFDLWKRTGDKQMAKVLGKRVAETWNETGRHFAYVHVLGPHSPLRPSAAARARWKVSAHWFEGKHGFTVGAAKRNREEGVRQAYRAAYHAAVEDTDALVAEVLGALGGHRADTLVIVTSDHGELLGEHGQAGHGWWLYEPLTHVPLIVDHPHIEGAREHLPKHLSNVAIPDLISRGLGVAADWPVGLADAPLLASRRDGREAIAFDGRIKVSWDERVAEDGPVAFELDSDPGEKLPVPPPANVKTLREAFDGRFPSPSRSPEEGVVLSTETQQQLKVLGYAD